MSTEPRPKKLLEQLDDAICVMHYSPRTGETYTHWIKRFILFHDKRHPKEMGAAEVQAFLTCLTIDQNVAASTQYQALSHSTSQPGADGERAPVPAGRGVAAVQVGVNCTRGPPNTQVMGRSGRVRRRG